MRTTSPAPLLLALFAMTAVGCQVGPEWSTPIEIAAPLADVSGKEVVVTDFRAATSSRSITDSGSIRTILESARVHDISLQVARALRAEGVNAQARINGSPSALRPDQVLLRGGIVATPWNDAGLRFAGSTAIAGATLGVLGLILPTPLSFQAGARVVYRAEIIDSDGRILMQTGDQPTCGYYNDYWFWGHGTTMEEAPTLLVDHARNEVVHALAGHFGRSPVATASVEPATTAVLVAESTGRE